MVLGDLLRSDRAKQVARHILLATAILAPDLMVAFLKEPYWIILFVISYLIAPLASRFFRAF